MYNNCVYDKIIMYVCILYNIIYLGKFILKVCQPSAVSRKTALCISFFSSSFVLRCIPVSIFGVCSNMAARFCPSFFFTQCPYIRNAAPSMSLRTVFILYGSRCAVRRESGWGVFLNRFSRIKNLINEQFCAIKIKM